MKQSDTRKQRSSVCLHQRSRKRAADSIQQQGGNEHNHINRLTERVFRSKDERCRQYGRSNNDILLVYLAGL
jgi:hypothetical protein